MELTLQNITKKYERVLVLNDISLTLKPGIYGLLGANGAGKTTLFRIIFQKTLYKHALQLYNEDK